MRAPRPRPQAVATPGRAGVHTYDLSPNSLARYSAFLNKEGYRGLETRETSRYKLTTAGGEPVCAFARGSEAP